MHFQRVMTTTTIQYIEIDKNEQIKLQTRYNLE